jgi:prephenate dehydrogenase
MNASSDLKNRRIAIVGLGLMGGSLALALQGRCAALYGVDENPATVELACRRKVVEWASCRPAEILTSADLVVLATPAGAILELLHDLPDLIPGSAVILDLGSTKRQIVAAMTELPPRFDPIGGHPMCGKESSGLENASADLFRSAPFALTALPRTSLAARTLAEQLTLAVGAHPLWIDAVTHDDWTAATSHLPYLLACALAKATPTEAAALVGPGFRSTTRVAATSPRMMLDILRTNTTPILEALGGFRREIDHIETLLRNGDWTDLEDELDQSAEQQRSLAGGRG